jgi:hypothetical protein
MWDVLHTAAADPWGFRRWNEGDSESEDVRYASLGQLSLTYWVDRPLRRLSVLNIIWLGQPPGDNAPPFGTRTVRRRGVSHARPAMSRPLPGYTRAWSRRR